MDQQALDDFCELLRTKPEGNTAKRQRLVAGLSLGQAAKLFGIERQQLMAIENKVAPLSEDLAAKMVEVYGLDVPPAKN